MAKWLIVLGALVLFTGIVLQYVPWMFNWIGRLPGDIRIESERSLVLIPITSMIVISVILTLLFNLFSR